MWPSASPHVINCTNCGRETGLPPSAAWLMDVMDNVVWLMDIAQLTDRHYRSVTPNNLYGFVTGDMVDCKLVESFNFFRHRTFLVKISVVLRFREEVCFVSSCM